MAGSRSAPALSRKGFCLIYALANRPPRPIIHQASHCLYAKGTSTTYELIFYTDRDDIDSREGLVFIVDLRPGLQDKQRPTNSTRNSPQSVPNPIYCKTPNDNLPHRRKRCGYTGTTAYKLQRQRYNLAGILTLPGAHDASYLASVYGRYRPSNPFSSLRVYSQDGR